MNFVFIIHTKKKQRRQRREIKYSNTTTTTKQNKTMCNYKLYTIARLVPNKSIQAVQLDVFGNQCSIMVI